MSDTLERLQDAPERAEGLSESRGSPEPNYAALRHEVAHATGILAQAFPIGVPNWAAVSVEAKTARLEKAFRQGAIPEATALLSVLDELASRTGLIWRYDTELGRASGEGTDRS